MAVGKSKPCVIVHLRQLRPWLSRPAPARRARQVRPGRMPAPPKDLDGGAGRGPRWNCACKRGPRLGWDDPLARSPDLEYRFMHRAVISTGRGAPGHPLPALSFQEMT